MRCKCSFTKKAGNSHPSTNSEYSPWYECDYSVITPKITEIYLNCAVVFFENLKL